MPICSQNRIYFCILMHASSTWLLGLVVTGVMLIGWCSHVIQVHVTWVPKEFRKSTEGLWNQLFYWPFQGGTSFVDHLMFFFCLVFAMPLYASVYMCLVVTCWERPDLLALVCGALLLVCYFPIGTWLYRFLIFAPLLTLESLPSHFTKDSSPLYNSMVYRRKGAYPWKTAFPEPYPLQKRSLSAKKQDMWRGDTLNLGQY